MVGGFFLLNCGTREEATEWEQRFPLPHGDLADAEVEVRQLFELEDFAPGDAIERFRALLPTGA